MKNKGDILIELMGNRSRSEAEVTNYLFFKKQYKLVPRNRTTDANFALRMLLKKNKEGQKQLHLVFVDLEKV